MRSSYWKQFAPSIRRGRWRYLDHTGSGGNRYGKNPEPKRLLLPDTAPGAPGRLYNLETEPGGTKNPYFDPPEIVKELKGLLEADKTVGRTANLTKP
jgi:hypothetical protein